MPIIPENASPNAPVILLNPTVILGKAFPSTPVILEKTPVIFPPKALNAPVTGLKKVPIFPPNALNGIANLFPNPEIMLVTLPNPVEKTLPILSKIPPLNIVDNPSVIFPPKEPKLLPTLLKVLGNPDNFEPNPLNLPVTVPKTLFIFPNPIRAGPSAPAKPIIFNVADCVSGLNALNLSNN